MKHTLLVVTLLFVLSACKTITKEQSSALPENYTLLSNQEKLELLVNWELSGKLAIITPKERQSAYVNWTQREQVTDFTLTNLLGVSLLQLDANAHSAKLETDGKTYEDSSKEALIYRTTGWLLPLDNLIFWIKGANNEQDIVELNENGLPKYLQPTCFRCAGWEINYSNYKQVDSLWLPYSIIVTHPEKQTTLKFRVSKWKRQ